ncbi:MAG TPA: chloride channel protein [Aliiroseovarius sp.]|nr:chloride channel protein [Aliiroseovarius sp.]
MIGSIKLFLFRQLSALRDAIVSGMETVRRNGPGQVQFWFLALAIGIASGFAALGFRLGIAWLQSALYGVDDPRHLHSFARGLAWYWIVAIPTLGGLVVGLVLNWFTDDGRVRSVADVIEGAALGEGRVELRAGLGSALASFLTLSAGGSSGREGPVVHLASVLSTWIANRIHANAITARELMGCAVAAAVSASFNAPIAGAIFALEVVLRHYAVRAFAPIAIASIAGTVISRLEFGNVTEFHLPVEGAVTFYVELPAFLILGLVSGLVAVIFMRAIFWSDDVADRLSRRLRLPPVLRPAMAGLVLGIIAIWFPHIIGVGYETTSAALTGELLARQAIIFALIKAVAVAITMAGRMGGGIFSPSLMMGALTGLAFGIIATSVFPDLSGSETLYALAGMGAVAAAVLGAPISTTLIMFELTGDWQTGIAVMAAVSLSTMLASRLVDRSFFLTLLERKGVHVAAGPQVYLMSTLRVGGLMRRVRDDQEGQFWEMIEAGQYLDANATLEMALPLFDDTGAAYLPVVNLRGEGDAPELLGGVAHVDALRAFNRALAAAAREEHS